MVTHSVRAVPAKRPTFKLMGSAEIGRRLGGVSRTRVYQLTQRRGFPEPYAQLDMGNVWLADDVEDWIRAHRPDLVEDPEGS
jgi:predicted DNA-binding transcriptional regulator AlpA